MATLDEMISKKSEYPDDTKITSADGTEFTLGQFRAGYMKDADYRRKTAEVARQREDLSREYAEREASYAQAEERLMALAKDIMTKSPDLTKRELSEELEIDPAAKKVLARMDELAGEVKSLKDELGQRDHFAQEAQRKSITMQHRRMLAKLKESDKDLDEEELVAYAQANYIPRLDVAYRSFKFDEAVKQAKKAGEEAGYEKARKEPPQPILPVRRPTKPVLDKAKTLDEAVDQALQDPEILRGLRGGIE